MLSCKGHLLENACGERTMIVCVIKMIYIKINDRDYERKMLEVRNYEYRRKKKSKRQIMSN